MSTDPTTFLTEEQYLEIERKAETKSEYFRGEMFAMSGGRQAHNELGPRFSALMYVGLGSRRCRIFSSDMKIRTKSGLYTYPDGSITCEQPQFLDERRETLLNPALILEVLSPSTEAYDRGRKFDLYKSIESLREYLLIASDRVHADLYQRQADGNWLLSSADSLQDSLELRSIGGVALSMAKLYEDIELAPTSADSIRFP